MRTYTTTINIKELLDFADALLKQEAGNGNVSLGWQLDMWICERVQKDYPEVDWVFDYTSAKELDTEIEIAVDFDIDEYRELMESIRISENTKKLMDTIKQVGETVND